MIGKLFDHMTLGGIGECKNRIVMAPLTRLRADPETGVLPDYSVEYYKARADAGLIIVEATNISGPEGCAAGSPGIWSDEQVSQWKKITDGIHEAGGKVVCQLSYAGMIRRRSVQENVCTSGSPPVTSHAKATSQDRSPFTPAREMTKGEIESTIQKYTHATCNAARAGFDGVEVRAARGYLPYEFMSTVANKRTDEYGCENFDNRLRFLKEVLGACKAAAWETDQECHVAIRVSPVATHDTEPIGPEPYAFTQRLFEALEEQEVAYIHISEPEWSKFFYDVREQTGDATTDDVLWREYKALLTKTALIGSGGYDRARAIERAGDLVDAVAFGRAFIANPDLVSRIENNYPIASFESIYLYTGGEKGYNGWPKYGESSPASTTA